MTRYYPGYHRDQDDYDALQEYLNAGLGHDPEPDDAHSISEFDRQDPNDAWWNEDDGDTRD